MLQIGMGINLFFDVFYVDVFKGIYILVYLYVLMVKVLLLIMNFGGFIVGMDFDLSWVMLVYNWMMVVKSVLELVNRFVVCEVGKYGVCLNFVVVGFIWMLVMSVIVGGVFGEEVGVQIQLFEEGWDQCVLIGWNMKDVMLVVKMVCVLLFDWLLVIMGDIIYVDGGVYI